jgi:hypothetical protein
MRDARFTMGDTTEMNSSSGEVSCAPARQRRLWEIRGGMHCSVIGTCLSLAEIRKLAKKLLRDLPRRVSDHDLHGAMVHHAQTKNPVSEALDKALNRRYAITLSRFWRARSEDELRVLWRGALADGDTAGPYWAVMTHPLAGEVTCHEAFGHIHMLSHVLGSSRRAELAQTESMRGRLAALRQALKESQATSACQLAECHRKLREQEAQLGRMRDLEAELLAARNRLASLEDGSRIARLELEVASHQRQLTETLRRAAHAEDKLAALQARAGVTADLARALADREAECGDLEAQLEALLARRDAPLYGRCQGERCPGPDLCGKRILYVGGRRSLVCRYRELVERLGGELLHHDGGAEDRVGRLAPVVAGVDAVLCPIDSVSHDACLQAKQMCKSHMKLFVPLRSAGLSSLARALGELGKAASGVGECLE